MVFTVSSIIRGSAAALPTVDALDKRAAFVDDITLATEQYIRARLGRPVEPAAGDGEVGEGEVRASGLEIIDG